MHLPSEVSGRMDYIQHLFLNTGTAVTHLNSLSEVLSFLDREPPEFRSIAYESASLEIASADLAAGGTLERWKEFRLQCNHQHSFHIDIGLGWAFAKNGMPVDEPLGPVSAVVRWMAFDGMGYYHALFKGRNTLKNKTVPQAVKGDQLRAFDQGVGRRLWYMAKGNVTDLSSRLLQFPAERCVDLWRGVGIACGYVGGNELSDLHHLVADANDNLPALRNGVILAAISRLASRTMNNGTALACRVICNKSVEDVEQLLSKISINLFYLYFSGDDVPWLSSMEQELI